jgi:hypothetical protein
MPRVKELHTADIPEPELSDIKLPELGRGLPERGDTQIAIPESRVDKDYLAALSFMEQPVTIRIEPSQEDNAPMTVDCWVNGKGAEVLTHQAHRLWMESGSLPAGNPWLELNILPVNHVCTTKRKYVEVLARSKTMKVHTPDHGDGKNIDNNSVTRKSARTSVFSVIKDSPKGAEWLTAILNESF